MDSISILPCGDGALTVEFGEKIDAGINARVCTLARRIAAERVGGIRETVPTFRSLLVTYDAAVWSFGKLSRKLRRLAELPDEGGTAVKRIIEIPVLYGGKYGEDLPDVAAHAGLSEEEVIRRHSEQEYLIYMLGFLPGFAYLGGLDKSIETPRLETPRTRIPAGSVGIGGAQTGIYPLDSPGGWRLIGNTPLRPYDPARKEPFLYHAGDYIKFEPVDEAEYCRIESAVREGSYQVKWTERSGV